MFNIYLRTPTKVADLQLEAYEEQMAVEVATLLSREHGDDVAVLEIRRPEPSRIVGHASSGEWVAGRLWVADPQLDV